MPYRHVIAVTCLALASAAAWSQDAPASSGGADAAAKRYATAITELTAEIDVRRRELELLQGRLEDATGLAETVFVARQDQAEIALLQAEVALATEVADARDAGIDVEGDLEAARTALENLPEEAFAAIGRIRARLPAGGEPETPADAVLTDQHRGIYIEETDKVLTVLVDYIDVAPRFDIGAAATRERLVTVLGDSAANRSVFMGVASRDLEGYRSAVAALAADDELRGWVNAMEVRVELASEALQSAVALMNTLDLETEPYREQLLAATGEITTDVLDVGFLSGLVTEWTSATVETLTAEGPRLLFKVLLALFILFMFFQLGKVMQAVTSKALSSTRVRVSNLLTRMILSMVRNTVVLIGILVAASQLGISLGPLLAGLGIAGFIIGFALQDSLSNFASGMMILVYRPFDVGDFVEVSGVKGTVNHMSLVNTTFLTIDNQKLVVPNNMVWQSVITNYTDQRMRRVDLVFGISYGDDIDQAEEVVHGVLEGYEHVLDDPPPVVRVGELGDSSVNLIVRPWVKTEHYWDTYWDLTKQIKIAFDRAGITIPFPQRDVHVVAAEAARLRETPTPAARTGN